jgi:hypothetical protein
MNIQQTGGFEPHKVQTFLLVCPEHFLLSWASLTFKRKFLPLATLCQAASINENVMGSSTVMSHFTLGHSSSAIKSSDKIPQVAPFLRVLEQSLSFYFQMCYELCSMKKHISTNLSIPSRLLASHPVFLIFAELQNQPCWVMWIPGFSFQ